MADTTTMWLGFAGPESHSIESVRHCQLRNSHHRSVSGFAENCTLVGISSPSTADHVVGSAVEFFYGGWPRRGAGGGWDGASWGLLFTFYLKLRLSETFFWGWGLGCGSGRVTRILAVILK